MAVARYRAMYIAVFIRPIIFVLFVRSLREAWRRIMVVVWDSKEILILWICYVLFFGWTGFRMFRGTQEGAARCRSMTDCFWNILI